MNRITTFAIILITMCSCSADKTAIQSRFALACAKGDLLMVREMLSSDKIDINAMNGKVGPCLVSSSYNGHMDIVKLMLERNANINVRDEKGTTPLVNAVVGNKAEIVELLLLGGADPDLVVPDANGKPGDITALKIARAKGNLEIVRLLETRKN